VSLRAVALPPEHGGWGFVLEPLILGLAVAPSAAGAALVFFALGAFLARHPLKLLLNDVSRGRWSGRAPAACAFAIFYACAALLGLALALASGQGRFWVPLLLAAPLALLQLVLDARNRGRSPLAEMAGAAAPGALVAAVVVAGGGPPSNALLLWLLLAARAVASVLYVRARLRLSRGLTPGRAPVLAGHLLALAVATALAAANLTPWLAVAAFGVLLGRAVLGLARSGATVRPQTIGIQEMGYGLLTVLLLALGQTLSL